MSYRDLRLAAGGDPVLLFEDAQRYAHYLWLREQPARAILALCRAIYIDPALLPAGTQQPYPAYVWLLRNYSGRGFLGNPRISFLHQAVRMPQEQQLKRSRAWALWHLTVRTMPDLPTDPTVPETPPDVADLVEYLDKHGLDKEGTRFAETLSAEG
jgi:hypothetical protein